MALDGMIGQARLLAADFDEVDPALDDSIYTSLINRYYLLWFERVERRIANITAADAFTFAQSDTNVTATDQTWFEIVAAFIGTNQGSAYGTPVEIVPARKTAAARRHAPR